MLCCIARREWSLVLAVGWVLASSPSVADVAGAKPKEIGVFYPGTLVTRARENANKYRWAEEIRKDVVDRAEPWMKLSDDELWDLMFGNAIKRSWMVWSNGYCPSCKKPVPMYTWQVDALKYPWKVRCPHCKELFPKNDFYKFYRSGLDEHGIFDPKKADRSLLFNTDHPDPKDPLHTFGVDDGEGYVEGDHRWRFIGAYLIYGQWKQAVHRGICSLASAYLVTGDKAYAHKAGVMLDRVADLYPSFDFGKEGVMYEGPPLTGYVSTWHDACEETRELALAYDKVRDALAQDKELAGFLSEKARKYGIATAKNTPEDVLRNIENGILRDPIAHSGKIRSNYPRTDIALAELKAVLGWPENKDEVNAILDPMIRQATSVDGVTGEKGLAGYASFTIQGLAELLGQFSMLDPDYLKDVIARQPNLKKSFKFHLDTWCSQEYYPESGDTGAFARKVERYVGAPFTKTPGIKPSMFTLFWRLYEATGDPAYVQILYGANGNSVKDLPHDLFAEDPEGFQRAVQDVIRREGAVPRVGSVNKEQWHIAILRSGTKPDDRALWLDYDSGGGHGHADGMNLGLFYKGLDLMPDFGYPPVNHGGWDAPKATWYKVTPAHTTVVVDGKNTRTAAGKTTLWADGNEFRAVRASGADLIEGKQYERTACLIDLSDHDSYILDVFRVVGGTRHDKFVHSHFGTITTKGLNLKPTEDYGQGTQMRNFEVDPSPKPGWSVDWKVDDLYHYLPANEDMHLRYTDLTLRAEAFTCEGWVQPGLFDVSREVWIPRVMVRRQAGSAPLASTFVSVIEPYEKGSNISEIRRLFLETPDGVRYPESNVAVEARLTDGRRDLLVSADTQNPLGLTPAFAQQKVLVQGDWGYRSDAELALVRRGSGGEVERVVICRGTGLTCGDLEVKLRKPADLVELGLDRGRARVVSGDPEDVERVTLKGHSVWR